MSEMARDLLYNTATVIIAVYTISLSFALDKTHKVKWKKVWNSYYDAHYCYFFGCWLQLFFKERIQDEQGYVLFVRKNALQVLIPKYGLEGTLFLNAAEKGASSLFTYNEEVRAQQKNIIQWNPSLKPP